MRLAAPVRRRGVDMKLRILALFVAVAALATVAAFFRPWKLLQSSQGTSQALGSSNRPPSSDEASTPRTKGDSAAPEQGVVVVLPPEKRDLAHIETQKVERHPLGKSIVVPGRLQYDDTRHVVVKAATAGVLVEVRVKPGDSVVAGQVLAILSSPEVGTARADVLQREGELEVLQEELAWRDKTQFGISKLSEEVGRKESLDALRKQFRDIPLGKGGEAVMTAYSRLRLAESLASGVAGMQDSGAVSQRTVRERLSELEAADAGLKGAIEVAQFESRQAFRQSQVGLDAARRRLDVSRQHLNTLLGYPESMKSETAQTDLSHVEIRAPFPGTIEQKYVSSAERTQLGESLFILADTSRLWVSADLRERDWAAVRLREGDPLGLEFPALPGRTLSATVHYVGREVSADSNAIPLVATIENPDGLLRPGLYVRVTIPVEASRDVLAVPEASVTHHDGKAFVFIARKEGEYEEVCVRPGIQDRDWVEITEGLEGDERVVTAGTFYLKSERLLEGEEP